MADNCRMCHPQQIHLHFNRGLECLNWQEKKVVAVRTSGFMGGPVGKALNAVNGDGTVIFLENLKVEIYNTYFYKKEAVVKIFFYT